MKIFNKNQKNKVYTATKSTNFAKLFSKLKKGEIFKGEIIDITHNALTIKLLNGTKINARLAQQLELKIGQLINFEVKSSSDSQIIIKPISTDMDLKINIIKEVLNTSEIPVSKENVDLIKLLIDNKMPIDKNFIHKCLLQLKNIKNMTLDALLFILKNNLPVESKTVHYLNGYADNTIKLSKQILDFINNLSDIIQTDIKDNKILNIFLPNNTIEIEIVKSAIKNITNESFEELEQINNFDTKSVTFKDIKELFKKLNLPQNTEKNFFQNIIKQQLINNYFIKYNDQSKLTDLDKFYTNLYEKISNAEKLLQNVNNSKYEKIAESFHQMKNNLEFLQQLNQNYTMLQIPIQLTKSLTQGDLYLIKNKKDNNKNKKNSLNTALLCLDLAKLGHLEIYIGLNNKTLRCQFRVENSRIKSIVDSKLIELKKQLINKGYIFENINVKVQEKQFNFLHQDDLKQQKDLKVKRYSFDMRV